MLGGLPQRYTYRVPQTIQMKLILLCVWAEWAVLGIADEFLAMLEGKIREAPFF